MTCNCMTRCRMSMFVTIDGREYPTSTHFPDCEKYQPERFVRVELNGSACVMEPAEAEAMACDSQEDYKLSEIYLTRDQMNFPAPRGGVSGDRDTIRLAHARLAGERPKGRGIYPP